MQLDAKWLFTQIAARDKFALVHLSFVEAAASLYQRFCNQETSWSSSFGWTEELCSQHLSQVGVLATY